MKTICLCRQLICITALTAVAQAALLDDFESGTKNNLMGGAWTAYSDETSGGNSTITNLATDPNGRSKAGNYLALPTAHAGHAGAGMAMSYQFGSTLPRCPIGTKCRNYVVLLTSLSSTTNGTRNLASATGFSFWAKAGLSTLSVDFIIGAYPGNIVIPLTLNSEWTKYSIMVDTLSNWTDTATFNREKVMTLAWEIATASVDNPSSATFFLDDVAVEGYSFTPTVTIGNDPASSANRRPSFRWHPVLSASSYTFELYHMNFEAVDPGQQIFDHSPIIKTPVNDTSYTPDADLDPGWIYWRVKSDISDWSIIGEYRIIDVRVPALKPLVPNMTGNTKPRLEWYPVTGAGKYTIQIAASSGFTKPLVSVPVSDTSYTPEVPLTVGTYYWRVQSDLVSTWSSTADFTIQPDSIPQIVRYNGVTTANKRPVFIWNRVPGAENYRFMLADNRAYANAVSIPLTDTGYTPAVDLASGKWYWKVSYNRDLALFCSDDSLVIGAVTVATSRISSDVNGLKVFRSSAGIVVMSKGPFSAGAVRVYDLSGRFVASPAVSQENDRGVAAWRFTDTQGRTVPAGVYLMRISTNDAVNIQRVIKR